MTYRGRFAPSPTGRLHFGSLVAAVASYADALHHQGKWLLRFDDVDETRTLPGSVDSILTTLDAFGFEWSSEPTFQTDRVGLYQEILDRLLTRDLAFYCGCSRKEIAAIGNPGIDGVRYPGTCRNGLPDGKRSRSIRLRVEDKMVQFIDRFLGPVQQNISKQIGDFVICRADGFAAYQLAVVVDDSLENITHVVRGADLLESTPRQLYLQQQLGFANPVYGHVPLVNDTYGKKLSKDDAVLGLTLNNPLPSLLAAWQFLGQVSLESDIAHIFEFWSEAARLWSPSRVPVATGDV
jgi:glutamyl-Q tRNA(Asp) synthetase